MLDYIAFLCCLEFAVLNSVYQDTVLKPKQVISLESVYLQKDVMCILPTGYGESLIFHLLLMLLFAKFKLRGDLLLKWRSRSISMGNVNSIVVVVSPLNSLMSDQISRLRMSGVQASVINIKESNKDEMADDGDENTDVEVNVDIDFSLCEKKKLCDGQYHIVFAHPESVVSCKYGRSLLLSEIYQQNVVAIVIDEAHCILDW